MKKKQKNEETCKSARNGRQEEAAINATAPAGRLPYLRELFPNALLREVYAANRARFPVAVLPRPPPVSFGDLVFVKPLGRRRAVLRIAREKNNSRNRPIQAMRNAQINVARFVILLRQVGLDHAFQGDNSGRHALGQQRRRFAPGNGCPRKESPVDRA